MRRSDIIGCALGYSIGEHDSADLNMNFSRRVLFRHMLDAVDPRMDAMWEFTQAIYDRYKNGIPGTNGRLFRAAGIVKMDSGLILTYGAQYNPGSRGFMPHVVVVVSEDMAGIGDAICLAQDYARVSTAELVDMDRDGGDPEIRISSYGRLRQMALDFAQGNSTWIEAVVDLTEEDVWRQASATDENSAVIPKDGQESVLTDGTLDGQQSQRVNATLGDQEEHGVVGLSSSDGGALLQSEGDPASSGPAKASTCFSALSSGAISGSDQSESQPLSHSRNPDSQQSQCINVMPNNQGDTGVVGHAPSDGETPLRFDADSSMFGPAKACPRLTALCAETVPDPNQTELETLSHPRNPPAKPTCDLAGDQAADLDPASPRPWRRLPYLLAGIVLGLAVLTVIVRCLGTSPPTRVRENSASPPKPSKPSDAAKAIPTHQRALPWLDARRDGIAVASASPTAVHLSMKGIDYRIERITFAGPGGMFRSCWSTPSFVTPALLSAVHELAEARGPWQPLSFVDDLNTALGLAGGSQRFRIPDAAEAQALSVVFQGRLPGGIPPGSVYLPLILDAPADAPVDPPGAMQRDDGNGHIPVY